MKNEKMIEETLEYIDNHLNENLELDRLAAMFYMSKYNYHRLFKSIVGKNVSEYIRYRRLLSAAMKLIETRVSIANISISVGYTSHSAFSRSFKEKFGASPKEYRNTHSKFENEINKPR